MSTPTRHLFRTPWIFLLLACVLTSSVLTRPVQAHSPAEAMAEAATTFLKSLDENQLKTAQYSFEDAERKNWNFVPMERKGLSLKAMKPHQQALAMGFLNSALSHRGFNKAVNIMALEQILHEMENGNPKRDPSMYHFLIFGEPSTTKTWGWRFEGHHLSMSMTLVDGHRIAPTPVFLGTNPAKVKQGVHEGLRVLHAEEDLARAFLHELDDEQRKVAVLQTEVPADVINLPSRTKAEALEPKGLPVARMTNEQRSSLWKVIREYVENYRPELAEEDLNKIRSQGFHLVHFAWIGSDQPGQPHYYRIQGPTFILEYDNTQNDANHVHVLWRDFENDFGADLLKEHYDAVKH